MDEKQVVASNEKELAPPPSTRSFIHAEEKQVVPPSETREAASYSDKQIPESPADPEPSKVWHIIPTPTGSEIHNNSVPILWISRKDKKLFHDASISVSNMESVVAEVKSKAKSNAWKISIHGEECTVKPEAGAFRFEIFGRALRWEMALGRNLGELVLRDESTGDCLATFKDASGGRRLDFFSESDERVEFACVAALFGIEEGMRRAQVENWDSGKSNKFGKDGGGDAMGFLGGQGGMF